VCELGRILIQSAWNIHAEHDPRSLVFISGQEWKYLLPFFSLVPLLWWQKRGARVNILSPSNLDLFFHISTHSPPRRPRSPWYLPRLRSILFSHNTAPTIACTDRYWHFIAILKANRIQVQRADKIWERWSGTR